MRVFRANTKRKEHDNSFGGYRVFERYIDRFANDGRAVNRNANSQVFVGRVIFQPALFLW